MKRLNPPHYCLGGMGATAEDIGDKAFTGLLSRADFGPAYPRERDFDAPTPRVRMVALALPAQIEKATCGRPMGKCAPEDRPTRFALPDFESKIEIPRLSRLDDAGMNFAFGILKTEPKPFLQRCARLHTVVDETDINPPLRWWVYRHAGKFSTALRAANRRVRRGRRR
jgi:hypothetical protein